MLVDGEWGLVRRERLKREQESKAGEEGRGVALTVDVFADDGWVIAATAKEVSCGRIELDKHHVQFQSDSLQ